MPKETINKKKKHLWVRRSLRIVAVVLLLFVIVIGGLLVTIQIPSVQTKISNYAIEHINQKFETELKVDSVNIDFFGDIHLYGIQSKDNSGERFITVKEIEVSIDLWELVKNQDHIIIDHIKLVEPKVKVITYKGESDSNFIKFINQLGSSSSEDSNFRLEGNIEIQNGKLLIVNDNLPESERIWLDSESVNGRIENIIYTDEKITAELKKLQFTADKNGETYKLKELSTNFEYNKNAIRFGDLHFETEDSKLLGSLKLSYDDISDSSDFSNKVQWELDLKDSSKVAYKDIRYWTEGWGKDRTVAIQGKLVGTLNDLLIQNLDLQSTGINITADLLNLKNITVLDDFIIVSEHLNLSSSYKSLNQLLPQELAVQIDPYLERFGGINFEGDFAYNSKQIDVDGKVKTRLGNAEIKARITNFDSETEIQYVGNIRTKSLDLSKLTNLKELGEVGANLKFEGKGTDLAKLKIISEGKVDYINLFGKRYQNILLDGTLENEVFSGLASIQDQNLQFVYNGIFDFSQKPYYLKFDSEFKRLDLDYLGLTNNKSVLSSVATGELYFTTIDEFTGYINFKDLEYKNQTNEITLIEANIESQNIDGVKQLDLNVPEYLSAQIKGNYILTEIPDALLNSFQDLIIDYEAVAVSSNQNFDFSIEMYQDLISQFYPDLNVLPNTKLSGFVDTNSNDIQAKLDTPGLNYSGLDFLGTIVTINTQNKENPYQIKTDSINIKGVVLKQVEITAKPLGDRLKIKTQFITGKENPILYDLNLVQTVNDDRSMILNFEPSKIIINQNEWLLNAEGNFQKNHAILNFEENRYFIEPISLKNSEQEVSFQGYYYGKEDFDFSADLKQLILSKIIPQELLGETKLDGIANGKIQVKQINDILKPTAHLTVHDIMLNNYNMGNLTLDGVYDATEEIVDIEAFLDQEEVQAVYINGYIDNKTQTPEMNITANFDEFNLAFLGSFIEPILTNVRGKSSGSLRFEGPIDTPTFSGKVQTQDLGFKVDYLNVDYVFQGKNDLEIFKPGNGQGSIQLQDLEFTDTRFNTKGKVTGFLLFRELSSWFFNLSFNTKDLLLLNTTERNNELFYGTLFGNGSFHFEGEPEDLLLEADAKITDNSVFTINTGSYFVDTQNTLVRFVPDQYKSEQSQSEISPAGIAMDMKIEVDEGSLVNLIFDSSSNDLLYARGKSDNLEIKMNRKGGFTMNGQYEVASGVYKFRRFPGLTKDFIIKPGGKINWQNSPYNANLDIVAVYPKLVSNVGEYLGVGFSQTHEVNLNILMKETLEKPEIDFSITIPKASTDIQSQLNLIAGSSQDEELRQFGFILLTGQFGVTETNVVTTGVRSAAAELALRQISNVLSAIAKEVQIEFDYVEGQELSQTSDRLGIRSSVAISDRVTLKTTGGVPLEDTYNENLTLEVEAEVDVSRHKDKTIVVSGFSRPTTFGVENLSNANSSTTQSYGAGISFNKSFNKFSDIFKSKQRIENQKKAYEKIQRRLNEKASLDSLNHKSIQDTLQSTVSDSTKQKKIQKKKSNKKSLFRYK